MHSNERESLILRLIKEKGFVSFRELEHRVKGSPATIRRDLERLAQGGKLQRVHGGAKEPEPTGSGSGVEFSLTGAPFQENIHRNLAQKRAIGRAAAALCQTGEGVMIDGGSTTLQMCAHLEGLKLQVLTNSLHIVSALIGQRGTRVLVPAGAVFPEQSIILSVTSDDGMPRFHAPKLFMGAAALGRQGLLQADVVLVAAERRLIERAEQVIVLADASKFESHSGNVVCGLDEIDIIITDSRIKPKVADMIESAGVKLVIADRTPAV